MAISQIVQLNSRTWNCRKFSETSTARACFSNRIASQSIRHRFKRRTRFNSVVAKVRSMSWASRADTQRISFCLIKKELHSTKFSEKAIFQNMVEILRRSWRNSRVSSFCKRRLNECLTLACTTSQRWVAKPLSRSKCTLISTRRTWADSDRQIGREMPPLVNLQSHTAISSARQSC